MKTKPFILGVLMTLVLGGCKSAFEKKPVNSIAWIQDSTDSLARANATEILALYKLSDDRVAEGYYFRSSFIGDADNREVVEYRVPATSWVDADQVERVHTIKTFEANISSLIVRLNREVPQPKKHSLVYQSICREMDALAKVDAQSHTLVINSDLQQNDDQFSFYRYRDFSLAEQDPQAAAKALLAIRPMPKVSNLKVYVINRPRTYEEQKKFSVAVRVFECLFQKQGAEMMVGPNISDYER